jgi:DNA-binding transcriptional LysR family regulator
MNYTLNQLQIFLKVVQTQSVTKAAEALHLTQPAVSIQLKNLQEQFEIPLTEVVGRRIYITDFGREIAAAAEKIFEQVYAINYKTLTYQGYLTGRLRFSVVSTGKYVLPHILSSFMQANAGIDLVMDVTNKERVLESLENNRVDFALLSVMPPGLNVEKIDLLQNKLYLVGSAHANSGKAKAVKEKLRDMPMIFREKGSGTRMMMERFIGEADLSVPKKIELTSNEAVKQAVIAGLGYSIMPLIGIAKELRSGELKVIEVPGLPITTTWSLVWLKGKKHAPVAAAFLDYLRKEKDRLVKEKFGSYDTF